MSETEHVLEFLHHQAEGSLDARSLGCWVWVGEQWKGRLAERK